MFGYIEILLTVLPDNFFSASTNPYSPSKHNHKLCRSWLFVTYIFLEELGDFRGKHNLLYLVKETLNTNSKTNTKTSRSQDNQVTHAR